MVDQTVLHTPISPVRQYWTPTEQAIEQYLAYEERYGRGHALLACHAAFPLIVSPELVNLIRINFLADQVIDWVPEADFLLTFCQPIDVTQGLYQVDPGLREVMLADLQESFNGTKRIYELADFLLAYGERYIERLRRPEVTRVYQWIAWSYLYPQKLADEMRSALLPENIYNMYGVNLSAYQIHIATMIEVVRDTFEKWSFVSEGQHQELLKTAQVIAHYWYLDRTPASTSIHNQQITRAVHQINLPVLGNKEKEVLGKHSLNIQITGGTSSPESVLLTARRLGFEIVKRGHRLLTYGSDGVDLNVVLGAYDACISMKQDPKEQIKIFRPSLDPSPSINVGYFEIIGKDFEECRKRVIRQSDILILLNGADGTFAVARQAQIQQKPIIPVGATGGTAEYFWQELMNKQYTAVTGQIGFDVSKQDHQTQVKQLRSRDHTVYSGATTAFQIDENILKNIGPSQIDEQELLRSILHILDTNAYTSFPPSESSETASEMSLTTQPETAVSDVSNVSDAVLLETIQLNKGIDERALGELFDRYESRIYSYIYRRTGNESLAEDLTAQVFLKVLETIRSDKGWHSSFSGWLYRIAHMAVVDYYRQRERQQQVPLDDTLTNIDSGHNPVVMAEASLDAQRLRVAISHLTEEQGEVIKLRFLEGYSISEVAEMLNKTEGSIKALQYRAVTTLRQLLQLEGYQ